MAKPIIVINTGPITQEHRLQLYKNFEQMGSLKEEYHVLVFEGDAPKGVQVFHEKDIQETTLEDLKRLIECQK